MAQVGKMLSEEQQAAMAAGMKAIRCFKITFSWIRVWLTDVDADVVVTGRTLRPASSNQKLIKLRKMLQKMKMLLPK